MVSIPVYLLRLLHVTHYMHLQHAPSCTDAYFAVVLHTQVPCAQAGSGTCDPGPHKKRPEWPARAPSGSMPEAQLWRAARRCMHIDDPGVAYVAKVIALPDARMVEEVGDEEELLQLVADSGVRAPQWRQDHLDARARRPGHDVRPLPLIVADMLLLDCLKHMYICIINILTRNCLRAQVSTAKDLQNCNFQPEYILSHCPPKH